MGSTCEATFRFGITIMRLLGLTLLFNVLLYSGTAEACTCAKPPLTKQRILATPIVIAGTVVAARIEKSVLTVEVETSIVWKGKHAETYQFTSNLNHGCSTSNIIVGSYYVFFTDEKLGLSFCSYTYQPGNIFGREETARRHELLFSLPHVRVDD